MREDVAIPIDRWDFGHHRQSFFPFSCLLCSTCVLCFSAYIPLCLTPSIVRLSYDVHTYLQLPLASSYACFTFSFHQRNLGLLSPLFVFLTLFMVNKSCLASSLAVTVDDVSCHPS